MSPANASTSPAWHWRWRYLRDLSTVFFDDDVTTTCRGPAGKTSHCLIEDDSDEDLLLLKRVMGQPAAKTAAKTAAKLDQTPAAKKV